MGSHSQDLIGYNGVAFSIDILEWGRTFLGFCGQGNYGKKGFKMGRFAAKKLLPFNIQFNKCVT